MKKGKITVEISYQLNIKKKKNPPWFCFNPESVKFCLDTFWAGIVKFDVKEIKKI